MLALSQFHLSQVITTEFCQLKRLNVKNPVMYWNLGVLVLAIFGRIDWIRASKQYDSKKSNHCPKKVDFMLVL